MTRAGPVVLSLLAAAAQPAGAQISSGGETILFRTDAAGVRTEPQFEPPPLMIGPVQANLRVTARSVAETNVFRTAKSGGDDVYAEIAPSAGLLASIGPHAVTFSARATAKRYSRFARENNETISLNYGGRLDLGPNARAGWTTSFARETEPRGAAGENLVSAEPAEFQVLQTGLSASTDLGGLSIGVAGSVVSRTFFPLDLAVGGSRDQSFRNTRSIRVAPRASFGVAGSSAVFVAGSAVKTTSLDRVSNGLRDSSGYTLLGGFRSETNGLVIGEIGVGWRGQQYRNPLFADFQGFTYDATVDWYPTKLVSVRVQAGQDVVNSGLANVAGILRRSLAARAYYDPLRNLRFSLALDRDHDAFRELDFSTSTVTATLNGRYQLGRHVDVSAFAQFQSKASTDDKRLEGYQAVTVGVALTGVL